MQAGRSAASCGSFLVSKLWFFDFDDDLTGNQSGRFLPNLCHFLTIIIHVCVRVCAAALSGVCFQTPRAWADERRRGSHKRSASCGSTDQLKEVSFLRADPTRSLAAGASALYANVLVPFAS